MQDFVHQPYHTTKKLLSPGSNSLSRENLNLQTPKKPGQHEPKLNTKSKHHRHPKKNTNPKTPKLPAHTSWFHGTTRVPSIVVKNG